MKDGGQKPKRDFLAKQYSQQEQILCFVSVAPGSIAFILHGDWLIGMVSSFIPYRDVAISVQTKRPRIIFEENAGLCNVVPAEIILELLQSPDFVEMDESLE